MCLQVSENHVHKVKIQLLNFNYQLFLLKHEIESNIYSFVKHYLDGSWKVVNTV